MGHGILTKFVFTLARVINPILSPIFKSGLNLKFLI